MNNPTRKLLEDKSDALGDLVHDVASEMASAVNNCGIEEQVAWLEEQGMTFDEICKALGL